MLYVHCTVCILLVFHHMSLLFYIGTITLLLLNEREIVKHSKGNTTPKNKVQKLNLRNSDSIT